MMIRLLSFLLAFSILVGCGDDPVVQGKPPKKRQVQEQETDLSEKNVALPKIKFSESDFIESESMRDPFRNFSKAFLNESRGEVSSQHKVILEQFAISELKLVAIISGIRPARAMLIDPDGLGHTVKRGEYIGRPAVMQPSGGLGAAYEVNWRIDQIRSEDLVLVRDDPSNPEVPSSTLVIPLSGDEVETLEVQSNDVKDELQVIQKRLAEIAEQSATRERAVSERSGLRGTQ